MTLSRMVRRSLGALAGSAAVALPGIALAASPRTLNDLVNMIVGLLDTATGVLIVAGLAIYLGSIATGLYRAGENGTAKLKVYFFWGVIILFVMVSIWGIVALLRSTIFTDSTYYSSGSSVNSDTNGGTFTPPRYSE